MRSPILALTWQIWRQGQKLAWVAAGVTAACALAAHLVTDKARHFENFQAAYYLMMILSLGLVFGIFHHAEFNPKRNWHGFPYRMFTLPVPTWLLVGCPMVLGVIMVELVYAAWARLVFEPFGIRISFWPAAVLGAGLPCYQALVWSLAGFRLTRLVVLAFAGMFFVEVGALPAFPSFLKWQNMFRVLGFTLIGLAVCAFFGGCLSVERQRRGGGRGRGWLQAEFLRVLDALPRRRAEFVTSAGAQFWFEWRRTGLLLPVCVAAALILIFVPVAWFTRKEAEATLWTLGWALALPVILATVVGQGFVLPDFWSSSTSVPSFMATRPFSAGGVVVTKMKAALFSAGLAWLPVLGFLGVWLPFCANTSALREWWRAGLLLRGKGGLDAIILLFLTFELMLTWRAMICGLWAGLSGSLKRCAALAIWNFVATIFAITGFFHFARHFDWKRLEQYVFWLQWGLAAAAAAKLWLAFISWRGTRSTRVGQYALIWAAGTMAVVALGCLVCPDVFWLKPLVIMAALLPFPLARLGFAPGALERNLHRP